MENLQIFSSQEFGEIRTITENDKTLFCGKDVVSALGYQNTNDAIKTHCRGVVKRDLIDILGRKQLAAFIPEGDIYRLAASSQLPGADKFESWIFDEVLPSIRKHGAHMMNELQVPNKTYCAYMHTNKYNGKKYIGITKNDVLLRWQNGRAYEHCKRFNAAIKEFGWDGFIHDVISSGMTLKEAKIVEQELINKYHSCDEEFGYNMSPGGGKISSELKAYLSKLHTGKNNPFYGKHHSDEFKRNLSHLSKTMVGEKSSQARPVICVNTGERFSCMVDAARKYGIKFPSDISKVCRGQSKSRGKDKDGNPLVWVYAPCQKKHKHHGPSKQVNQKNETQKGRLLIHEILTKRGIQAAMDKE